MKLYPDLAEAFVAESGRARTKSSVATFKQIARQCQRYAGPDVELTDFTTELLTGFCLHAERVTPAKSTVNARRSLLTVMFKWATWKGYVDHNPALDLEWTVNPGHGTAKVGRWLSDREISRVVDSCDRATLVGRRNRILLLTGFFTGLRCMELASLEVSSVADDLSSISFLGKGRKWAEQPVPEQLAEELEPWLEEIEGPALLPRLRCVWADNPGRKMNVEWDAKLNTDGIAEVCRTMSKRSGIRFSPHDMRRSYAGWLDDQGLDILTIQELMRHSSVEMTQRYLSRNPNRKKRALAGLKRAV